MTRKMVAVLCIMWSLVFESKAEIAEKHRPPSVVVYSMGRLYWTMRDDFGGEDLGSVKLRRYFVGDEIWAKLLFTTGSLEPIPRQVFESALQCLNVALFELPDGKAAPVWNGKYTPKFKGRLGSVRLDSKDRGYNKQWYRSTEGGSDGVYTEWFDVAKLVGGNLPAGTYQFAVIPDPSCGGKFNLQEYGQGDLSVLQIHEANTPDLQAMKLCWEGEKKMSSDPMGRTMSEYVMELQKKRHDLELLKRLVQEHFLPALAIKPNLKCALRNMAQLCKLQDDKECYEKYQKAFCDASTPGYAVECRSRMETELKYWNPGNR